MGMRTYDVVLSTELGPRYGVLQADQSHGQLTGTLRMFSECHAFSGTCSEAGECRLEGDMRTLLRDIHYTASGRMDEQSLDLTLKGLEERDQYRLTGLAVSNADCGVEAKACKE